MVAIAVLGAGFLGTRLAGSLPGAALVRVDITDRDAVRVALGSGAYAAAINAAGKTGRPNVDWCETHQTETYRANVLGPFVVAEVCAELGMHLLHLGSGCIFSGGSPQPGGWRETDPGNPSSFYARTKYAADLVLSRLPGVAVARVRMPIDFRPGPRNLITKLAAYPHVIDVENSVTVVDDLVEVVRRLVELRATGVFHATNPGSMRHSTLLALYREMVDPSHRYDLIRAEELVTRGLAAVARSNCVLAGDRLMKLGIRMRPIDVALRDAMERYAHARTRAERSLTPR
jgi:dTDP-4-dehydrorhamnose reductase